MTENKRFIIDDVGTLIDIQTRNTYDYVSDVCPLLNALNEENEQLKQQVKQLQHWNKCLAEKRHQELKGDDGND